MTKGKFIVLDGNDGSGKATQTRLLTEYLTGKGIGNATFTFPSYKGNFFGSLIGECLAGRLGNFVEMDPKVVSPLYALDRLETRPQILKALEAGEVVLADRYASSNQIHQGGKIENKHEREMFLLWLDKMEHEIIGNPRPDAIIYLDVPVEISLELLSKKREVKNNSLGEGKKDMVEEDRQYLEQSHATAKWLAGREKNWCIVSCMDGDRLRTPDEIHAEVVKIFESL